LPLAFGPDTKPPWLDVDAAIPESCFGSGNRHFNGSGDIEIDEVVTGGSVSDIHVLAIYRDGEGLGAKLFRNWDWLNAGCGERSAGERKHSNHEHTKSTQEVGTCK
jgi:hypothetical protein